MPVKKTRIINKHETQEDWEKAVNFQPLQAEIIVYDSTDPNVPARIKIGDGISFLKDLPFFGDNRNIWEDFTDAPAAADEGKTWEEF